ncbi:MAG: 4-hydroxythreonine-4-phosphate dehydrogenase PdxA [Actinobacteria bacterium]|nr:4-hydroxythreonine-4-phosphate dehydrogenase PdxA [Actinomycetota bacterium]
MKKPVIAITMGDAAGIGPEISVKALLDSRFRVYEKCNPFIIGDAAVISRIIRLCNLDLKVNAVDDIKSCRYMPGSVDVLDFKNVGIDKLEFGVVNSNCGEAAVHYTKEAGKMALDNRIQAIVSAPLNKASMRAAGYKYEGQTEILGELTGSKNYSMMLILDRLRIMMYSTHMSLRQAIEKVTYDGVLKKILLSAEGLKFFNLENPLIAVSALNPHAGEGGLFGTEEIDHIIPAINKAMEMGINVTGPVPADVVFVKAKEGEYDLVIAMYHDQANMAIKLLGFGSVVTLLAGLPIIRTSTGHGTAFDIAGKNIADETNLFKAILLAAELGAKRMEKL